jgi:hypothetical protein
MAIYCLNMIASYVHVSAIINMYVQVIYLKLILHISSKYKSYILTYLYYAKINYLIYFILRLYKVGIQTYFYNRYIIFQLVILVLNAKSMSSTKEGSLVYGVLHYFQQYFSYVVAVRFIGGGNPSTCRKPPTKEV